MSTLPANFGGVAAPGSSGSPRRSPRTSRSPATSVPRAPCTSTAKPVVDIWGGLRRPRPARPWERDTIVITFSCTKGATAVCANKLIQEGRLDPDAPIARVLAGVRGKRQGDDPRPVGAVAPRRARCRRRHAHPRRRLRVGSGRRSHRRAGSELGAGHRARLPRAFVRMDRRRDHPPRHGREHGSVLRPRGREAARPRLLHRPSRRGRVASRDAVSGATTIQSSAS